MNDIVRTSAIAEQPPLDGPQAFEKFHARLLREAGSIPQDMEPIVRAVAQAFADTVPQKHWDQIVWDDNFRNPKHPESTFTRPKLIAEMVYLLSRRNGPDSEVLEVGTGYGVSTKSIALCIPQVKILSYEADTELAHEADRDLPSFLHDFREVPKRPRIKIMAAPFQTSSLTKQDKGRFTHILVNAGIDEETLKRTFLPLAKDGCIIVAPVIKDSSRPKEQKIICFAFIGDELLQIEEGSDCGFVEFQVTEPAHASAR